MRAFVVPKGCSTVSRQAARLCDADSASIHRPEGDSYPYVASYGFSREFDEYMRHVQADPEHTGTEYRSARRSRSLPLVSRTIETALGAFKHIGQIVVYGDPMSLICNSASESIGIAMP